MSSQNYDMCHVCGAGVLNLIPQYSSLKRITSDCKSWPSGGELAVCQICGTVQKIINPAWEVEIKKIYDDYTIYHQSAGVEQAVFNQNTGQPSTRSIQLLTHLSQHVNVPDKGRLLDIGCGNGATLKAFNHIYPEWSLAGTEYDEKYKSIVELIPGVEALYTCPPQDVPRQFNLITMVHVLEHIAFPLKFLHSLREKLIDGGLLVIEVPNHVENPFELLIADHSTHFSKQSLVSLLETAGFSIEASATNWIPKELSVVAKKAQIGSNIAKQTANPDAFAAVDGRVEWLLSVLRDAEETAKEGPLGLFGTSIAATWLWSHLKDSVSFFVDEDPNRIGRRYHERPIYSPADVPEDGILFIALPPSIAYSIEARLKEAGYQYVCRVPQPLPTV
jgi:SAM-dependent methyltransferase